MSLAPNPTIASRTLARVNAAIRAQRAYWLDYTIIFGVFIVVYIGIILVREQYYPDSAHYLAMSLWFSGTPRSEAFQIVYDRNVLNGYDPNSSLSELFDWGLVKPRVVLPVLSIPFMWIFGQNGLVVTTGVITVVLVFVLYKFLARLYGRAASVVTTLLMLSSMSIMGFSVAMLTESLSALWGVLTLAAAYRFQRDRRFRWIALIIVLTLLSAFTRQATLIVAGAFVVAFLLSLFRRSDYGAWGWPALAAATTSIGAQVMQTLLFPFSQANQYERMTGTHSLWGAILATPGLIKNLVEQELASYIHEDQALIVLLVLCAISVIVFWRRTESHLLIGAFLGIALYSVTNGNATHFRYAVPGLVFFLGSMALLVSQVGVRLTQNRPGGPVGAVEPGTPRTASPGS